MGLLVVVANEQLLPDGLDRGVKALVTSVWCWVFECVLDVADELAQL